MLAIIGVLTIGALAGFKQVMYKYKAYKQTDQLSILFNAIFRNLDKFKKMPANTYFMSTLVKLKEVPDDMVKNSINEIYDPFGIRYYTLRHSSYIGMLGYIDSSEQKQYGCENVYKIAQKYSQRLHSIFILVGGNIIVGYTYFGDNFCNSSTSQKCLKDIKTNEFDGICNYCREGQICRVWIRFWIQ